MRFNHISVLTVALFAIGLSACSDGVNDNSATVPETSSGSNSVTDPAVNTPDRPPPSQAASTLAALESGETVQIDLDRCERNDQGYEGRDDPYGAFQCGETYEVI